MRKTGPSIALALLFLCGMASISHAQNLALRESSTDAPAPPIRSAYDNPAHGDYVLGTGDKVKITVYGEDDLSGTFQVDAKGFVQLPLVGAIAASGGSGADLAERLEAALSDGFMLNPRVNVEVTQYRPFYVIGEVNKPGQYDYVNDMSAPNVIALAGGYTEKAVESWIYVRHADDQTEHREPMDPSTKIEPGDVVRVPN